jgi:hypothetical protein
VLPVTLPVTARLLHPALSPRIDNPRKETAMNDPDPAFASYDRYREALGKASQSNKTVVFDALAAANITSVVTDFDGEGDGGGITGVTAYCGEKEIELPASTVILQQASLGTIEIRSVEEKLSQAVEILCYAYLEETHGGWENNDGGFGEFRLDVVARTVELEFNGRFSDTYTENHTF